jgi:CheY-like chemotaxis protein
VCKRLIEGMGGLIGVDSTVGTGSTFWIELQVTAEETAADTGQVPLPAEAPAAVGESSRTVLCVEDNPANLMLVEEIVARRPGIHLLCARDGRRGLEMARASRPEVILMDINLPDLSGIEALKLLAEDPLTAHIPVIALSANARPDDVEKALQAGFFRYVTKPIQINALMATLELAFESCRATVGRRQQNRSAMTIPAKRPADTASPAADEGRTRALALRQRAEEALQSDWPHNHRRPAKPSRPKPSGRRCTNCAPIRSSWKCRTRNCAGRSWNSMPCGRAISTSMTWRRWAIAPSASAG